MLIDRRAVVMWTSSTGTSVVPAAARLARTTASGAVQTSVRTRPWGARI